MDKGGILMWTRAEYYCGDGHKVYRCKNGAINIRSTPYHLPHIWNYKDTPTDSSTIIIHAKIRIISKEKSRVIIKRNSISKPYTLIPTASNDYPKSRTNYLVNKTASSVILFDIASSHHLSILYTNK